VSSDFPCYKGQVLLVDDAKVNLMLGRKLLQNFGLEVVTADNGQEAIDLCRTHTFQLILMDLEMPKVGGMEAACKIREDKLSFAPIVALTGTENDAIRSQCKDVRMNGFLSKPLTQASLAKILKKIF
jgi:CheY-like chemotaxis protein